MKRFRKIAILCLGLSVWLAGTAGLGAGSGWLAESSIDIQHFLAPPPQADSKEGRTDLDVVLRYQASRSTEDCRRAQSEMDVSLKAFFGPPYGPLSATETEKWSPFFDKVRDDTEYFVHKMKKIWRRPRPFTVDPKITPCFYMAPMTSYPSGHATHSRIFSKLLSELKPDLRPVFEARADRIAEDRVLAGVHFPSDIEAGKKLGDEIARRLLSNEDFRKELAGLKETSPAR